MTNPTTAAPAPTEAMWGGLARDIIKWMDSYQRPTPETLLKHLSNVGTQVPQWLLDEPEMRNTGHVMSAGTRATLVWRAMQEAAPQVAQQAQPVGEAFSVAARGVTMATFRAHDVPAGTKLYTAQPAPAREPLTDRQVERVWNNSPEHHKDAPSFAAFKRLVRLVEAVHSITHQPKEAT